MERSSEFPNIAFALSTKVISSPVLTAISVPLVVLPLANTCARVGWKSDVFNCDNVAYFTTLSLASLNIILSVVARPTPVPSEASFITLEAPL